MCFSLEASLAFAGLGLVASALLYARGRPMFFATMELLQAAQYVVMAYDDSSSRLHGSHDVSSLGTITTDSGYADQSMRSGAAGPMRPMCMAAPGHGSWANKLLMVLSWAHLAFQPYFINL